MDIRKVKKLIELLEASGIAEIEIREGEEAVRISRYGQGSAPVVTHTHVAHGGGPPAPAAESGKSTPPAAVAPRGHTVIAPMVGTYYFSPAPGSKPFVEIGQQVEVGATLCVIEAMKILNQIESDKAGAITGILVENGRPVEYGQPLFIIE